MKKSKSKKKKVVIAVSGMILAVSIGAVGFKYKNEIIYTDNIVSEYMSENKSLFEDKQDGEIVWENTDKNYKYTAVTNVDDGVIACASTGQIVKYDMNGKVVWENTDKTYSYQEIVTVSDGVVVSGQGKLVKYGLDGSFIWENTGATSEMLVYNNDIYVLNNGLLTKFNSNNGEVEWTKEYDESYKYMTKANDGIMMAFYDSSVGSYPVQLQKVDDNGEVLFSEQLQDPRYKNYTKINDLVTVKDGIILLTYEANQASGISLVKFGFDGSFKWSDEGSRYIYGCETTDGELIGVTTSNEIIKLNTGGRSYWNIKDDVEVTDVVAKDDSIMSVSSTGKVSAIVSKYTNTTEETNYNENNGEIAWENTDKDYNYTGITKVIDGAVACASTGQIVKYDMNGNIIWENSDKTYNYQKIVTVADGIIASSSNNIVKYGLDGSILWENTGASSEILVNNNDIYSLNYGSLKKYNAKTGEVEWNKSYGSGYAQMVNVGDGIIMMSYYTYDDYTNFPIRIQKVDYEGNEIFNDMDTATYYKKINDIVTTKDGIMILTSETELERGENLIKYSFDGEREWSDAVTHVKYGTSNKYRFEYGYEAINKDFFGIDRNTLTRFDSDGRAIWEQSFAANVRGIASFTDSTIIALENGTIAMLSDSYLDRSALDEILEEVGKLEESDYSDETWQDLQDAITGTDDLTSQDEIDAKVDEIQEAIDNLDVDRSELDKILEEVGKLEESDYSDETWQDLQDAIAGADDLTKQSEIDAKVDEIQEAIDNLDVDRSALDALLEQVAGLNEADYSDSSWDALQNAIAGTDNLTKQSEIDAKVQEIQNALDNLDVDRSALDALLEQVAGLNEADYSDSSWDALQNAIAGTDNLTKQSEIDAKVQEIQNALDNLDVDRSALDALLEQVAGLNEADYSDSSWDALQGAISGTDNLTKQSEIDAKVQEIQNALDNLGVDRSALDALLEQVAGLNEADYSDSSWDALQGAISGTDNLTKQSEIDAKVQEIQNALSGLGVDRSALDALLEQVAGLNESDYSNSSWDALQGAISGTDNLTKQSEIDAKVQEIQNALNGLGVDRSALDALLEQVAGLIESDYSDESWQELQEAVSGADSLVKQTEIDAKVDEIQEAIDNLGVDRSELDRLLTEVGRLTESDYSDSSWDALQNAIAGTDNLTKQSEIDTKVQEIQNALSGLGVDRSTLDALLEQVAGLNEADYSNSSWDALQDAISGTDNLTKQSEIDSKVQEIQNALDNLGIDRSVLDALLENVSKLNPSDYSDESWNALQQAITGTDNLTKQSEIDAKVEEIKNAVDGLGIDRSALDAILAEVEKLVETDYSKASWDVLENAVNMSDTVTTQSQVDNAVEQIRNAMDGLTIDRSQLDRLLEEVKKLNSSDYSNSSWNALQQAITGTDNLTKQSEIDAKVNEIQNAINNLGIDRSELDRLLEEIRNLKERDYSVESWTNLQNVVKGSDTLTKQDEVNKKVDDLQKALAALTVDRTKLDEIIKKVESMDSTKYTIDSWQALEGLLDVDELTKQYEIDDRVEDIQDAINNLILDMSKLEDLIDQSENLNKDDYTEDSWNNLDQTVTDIKDKINNGEINEDNIDDYVTKLQDALNSLQKNEDKNATDDQNVNTSDIMGMGLILTFIVSVLGILKNVKKFIFKK